MPDARRECYDRLIDFMYENLKEFYEANPDLIGDQRSCRAIAASRDGMAGLLKILDEYEIQRKA